MTQLTRKELLELLKTCSPRTRKTLLRLIEGKASQDGASYIKETMDFMEEDQTVRRVEVFSSRTCDFGHVLDQQTRIVATCQRCGAYTCSAPGCGSTCLSCGGAFCRRHISVYADGECYCPRCRPKKWFRLFFDLKRKG